MIRERELGVENLTSDNFKALLPEIAELINSSVSSLERYPTDLQRMMCQIYIDNSGSDKASIRQALGRILDLNGETSGDTSRTAATDFFIEQKKSVQTNRREQSERTETEKNARIQKRKSNGFLTREMIIRNAKIISEKRNGSDSCSHSEEIETEKIRSNK